MTHNSREDYLHHPTDTPYNVLSKRKPVMPPDPHRTARIEARIAPEALAVIKRAAAIRGRSVSAFMVAAAQEAAHRAIEETQVTRLSVEDQRAFADAILNPPEPALALRRAFRLHRDLIEQSR